MADSKATLFSGDSEMDHLIDTIEYGDSASQTGGSDVSKVSIAPSARLRAAAEKAILQAEFEAEKKRQLLEEEELKLAQRRRQLELETKIAKAAALEKTFALAESGGHYAALDKTSIPVFHSIPSGDASLPNNAAPVNIFQMGDILSKIMSSNQHQQQSLVETLQMPKTELMTFDGNPVNYWQFIRTFDNVIEKNTIPDSAKLARLQQYCVGPARNLIQCCMVKEPSEGYNLARQLLKERFGNEFNISEAWIKKVIDRPNIRDNKTLLEFSDDLRNCRETLHSMGKLNELNNSRSLLQIVEKLPFDLKRTWLRRNHHIKTVECRTPTIDDVMRFVSTSAQQANDPVFGKILNRDHSDKSHNSGKTQDTPRSRRSNFNTQVEKPPAQPSKDTKWSSHCAYCGQAHGLFGCDAWKSLKVADRLNFVQSKRLCVNCLLPGHRGKDCTRNTVCTVPGCGLRHTKFLHLPRQSNNSAPVVTSASNNSPSYGGDKPTPPNVSCNTTGAGASKVALPVVPIKVRGRGSSADFIMTFALLDTGSTQSFCSEELIEHLDVPKKRNTMKLTTLDSCEAVTNTFIIDLEAVDINEENFFIMSSVMTRPKLHISPNVLVTQKEVSRWPHLAGIPLPDVDANEVHLLIGQDNPSMLVPKGTREGGYGAPYATKTILGWTLNGPIETGPLNRTSSFFVNTDYELMSQVEKFWKLDNTGDEQSMSISDKKVLATWEKSLQRDGKHYSLNIPFKTRPPYLPDNRSVAEHRLRLLGKRLSKSEDMKSRYTSGIADLLAKGYAEEVPHHEICRNDGVVWYLPHHPVINPRKPEKTRIVFDCSAKCQGISLNDKVYQGPDLTNRLVGVLLRFRQESIALMSDVEAMFHQVRVNKHDRDALRFLWWTDDDFTKVPKTYRMTSHLFGGVWSPSCASFALKRTAQDNIQNFDSETINTIDRNFYVDDCLKSIATTDEAIRLVKQVTEVLSLGGFHLTKWMSNSREVLHTIPAHERAKGVPSLDLDGEALPRERALGVLWDVESDTLTFDTNVGNKPLTRRGILSTLSSVYDPLGFVNPYVFVAKVLFQEACRQKIGWDDPVPHAISEQWGRWMNDLPELRKLSMPRCLKPKNFQAIALAQLHHFSDASEKGYGAATYLRLKDISGLIHCVLLMAKSRLAPMKSTTIPRLELSAAVISVKLDEMICRELSLPLQESIYWTDSMIVIQYLRNEDKRYQTFVANRVAKILEHSKPHQWRHVDTHLNPGDDVSRGVTAMQLVDSYRWINGPQFLWQSEADWPPQPHFDKALPEEAETKTDCLVYKVESSVNQADINTLLERYSSWYRLKKGVAWILRLKAILLAKVRKCEGNSLRSKALTVSEIQTAEKEIVRYVQRTSFDDKLFKSGGYRKLVPVVSDDGIIHVGGRLHNSNLPTEAKHPWILPAKHPVTTLIVRHYHELTAHSGSERTLAELRQRFWIVKGRSVVKNIIFRCIPCRRRKAPLATQQMADLPKDRVTSGLAPFSMVGIDYFGPFIVKRGRSEQKRYGCIFTCLTTRAVHLEVCHSLDTDSFINAMQRFIGRRGEPVEIRSDNGTNLVGGMRAMREAIREWNQNKIEDFLRQREVKWLFNPPAASHFGGVWERQIRSVRAVLNSLLNSQALDDEGLATLMCIVEGIINGRPLTKLSDDPSDLMPLTPNHILLLRAGPQLPPGNFVERDLYRRRWRQVQYLADMFWKRWLKEYLPSLQERQKWVQPKRNIQVGDLVLVRYENTPRNRWPLGLVQNTYPGGDGMVRSVQIKTQTGVYDRPIDKLCLLEGDEIQPA